MAEVRPISAQRGRESNGKVWESITAGVLLRLGRRLGEASLPGPQKLHSSNSNDARRAGW